MELESGEVNADADTQGREAIWRGICSVAEQLLSRCQILMRLGAEAIPQALLGQPIPDVRTWQLVEGLSLLTMLLRADDVRTGKVTLFMKEGPLEIIENGQIRYLWSQYTVQGHFSEFGGRPDLIVTSNADVPTPANILRVVEVKCVRRLGASTVRAEFAKAHDLRVSSYFVWSYFTPDSRIVTGAEGLGIDLHELGLDLNSASRSSLIANSSALVSKVAHTLDVSRQEERFARQLILANKEVEQKRLTSSSDVS
ncbi:MAG: hypothetical protein KME45_19970 [Stenomitos rutilans HA7619-LM2]|jgi:hypothetical protein|nr:hypothetical protein [Stenomitos rutilans HA7619-LM2]